MSIVIDLAFVGLSAVLSLTLVVTLVLRYAYHRPWRCPFDRSTEQRLKPFVSARSRHVSQHLFDDFTLLHTNTGVVLAMVLSILGSPIPLTLSIVYVLAVAWELWENHPMAIDGRSRGNPIVFPDEGDSIVNALSDIAVGMAGCGLVLGLVAELGIWPGVLCSLVVSAMLEYTSLISIRDGLTVAVVVILGGERSRVVRRIRDWQAKDVS